MNWNKMRKNVSFLRFIIKIRTERTVKLFQLGQNITSSKVREIQSIWGKNVENIPSLWFLRLSTSLPNSLRVKESNKHKYCVLISSKKYDNNFRIVGLYP